MTGFSWLLLGLYKVNWAVAYFYGDDGIVAMACIFGLMLALAIRRKDTPLIIFASGAASLGLAMDALLGSVNVFQFNYPPLPLFLILLWLSLALVLPVFKSLLGKNFSLCLMLFAPLSYYLASEANHFAFPQQLGVSLVVLGCCWFAFSKSCEKFLIHLKSDAV
ncbi:DUF2878 family protein [Paraferrimonas haliotis]|uniref:DUF2878 domain-containing protein n=1 Tax=Paraferrimonas haliotis TaxID=2013866 RepID=A0AA37WZ90_9GAMM|nr:DUF2878 family protein [Paraferrimonas haliotis]GLS84620.1 hypothetical protein GCM10007894_25970 [Paraferrimonas haliotis]